MRILKRNRTADFDEEAICINCVYAQRLDGADACVCLLKGAVKADGSCKKFRLDLLKIDPQNGKNLVPQGKATFFNFFEKTP